MRSGTLFLMVLRAHGQPTPRVSSNVLALADFLAGDVSRSSIAVGDPTRLVFVKTFSLFAQDAWQFNQKLTFNYGLRWDYEGPLGKRQEGFVRV